MPDDIEEPTGSCICCALRKPHYPPVCDLCRTRLARALWEVRDLHALLPAALAPGQGETQRVSGSREAPLPLRVGPLDLAGQASAQAVHDEHGDQEGSPAVATVLDSWARDWAECQAADADSPNLLLPDTTVPALVSWLSRHLQWALNNHPAIDEFNREVITLLYVLRSLLNVSRAPTYLRESCPTCGLAALRREAMYQTTSGDSAGGDVVCGNCHRVWAFEDFDRLVVVLADETVGPGA